MSINRDSDICDQAEIVRALSVILEPGQTTELRALNAAVGGDRWKETVSGYFDDPQKLAQATASITSAQGIYFIPNVPNPALLGRAYNRIRPVKKEPTTSDGDMLRRRWLLVDADAVRPAGISSTDDEHKLALERAQFVDAMLRVEGWPSPIYGDSGNGGHLLYRIDLPADDGGLCERCLQALDRMYSTETVKIDTTTANPARIWRLYGAVNSKGDSIPDRPHRMAKLLSVPTTVEVVSMELLNALAAQAAAPTTSKKSSSNGHTNGKFDLATWITKHGLAVDGPEDWNAKHGRGQRWVFSTCPWNSSHTNRSAWVAQFDSGELAAGCHHDGCAAKDWRSLRDQFEPGWRQSKEAAGTAQQKSSKKNAGAETGEKRPAVREPVLVNMEDVEPKEVQWLWPSRLPMGRIALLVGRPGEGKSFLTTEIAARVTTGSPWPDDSGLAPQGSVLFICAEDDPADTIRPRLDAARADVHQVKLLSMVRRTNPETGETNEVMFTLADVYALEMALQQMPDCKLIIIDPIGSFLGGSTDSHRDNEVRGVLAPVAALAAKYGPAVLVVAHRRKSSGDTADDLALGSRAFTGIARAVWHLSRDKGNPHRRLLLGGKNNLAAETSGVAFTIGGGPPCICWEHDAVEMSADDALAQEHDEEVKPGPEPDVRNIAADWLRDELADLQEHPVSVLREASEAAGVGSYKTLQRAAQEIGVIVHRASFGGGYVWRLPKAAVVVPTMQDMPSKSERTCPPVQHDITLEATTVPAGQVPLVGQDFSLVQQGQVSDIGEWAEIATEEVA